MNQPFINANPSIWEKFFENKKLFWGSVSLVVIIGIVVVSLITSNTGDGDADSADDAASVMQKSDEQIRQIVNEEVAPLGDQIAKLEQSDEKQSEAISQLQDGMVRVGDALAGLKEEIGEIANGQSAIDKRLTEIQNNMVTKGDVIPNLKTEIREGGQEKARQWGETLKEGLPWLIAAGIGAVWGNIVSTAANPPDTTITRELPNERTRIVITAPAVSWRPCSFAKPQRPTAPLRSYDITQKNAYGGPDGNIHGDYAQNVCVEYWYSTTGGGSYNNELWLCDLRGNRTLQEEFIQLSNYTPDTKKFNKQLTNWLIEYNFNRPHQSLGYDTPIEYHMTTNKLLPRYSSSTGACFSSLAC